MPYDLEKLTKWSVPLIWALIISEAVLLLHIIWSLRFFYLIRNRALSDFEWDEMATQIDLVGGIVGIGYIVVLVLCFVANGMWIYRASSNARFMDADPGRVSPGWAVGWYFIPIASLWMPFRAMKQIWNTTMLPGGDLRAAVPGFIGLWWATWVVSNLIANASFRISMQSDDLDAYIRTSWMDIANAPISILSTVLFLRLVKEITVAQSKQQNVAEVFA